MPGRQSKIRDTVESILWLRSWERNGTSWGIRAACMRAGKVEDLVLPAEVLNKPKAYDIDAVARLGRESLSLGIDIEDMASLSPLVDATDVLKGLHPRLQGSDHVIYVGYSGETPIYFPAALLIRTLWLWSDWVLPTLLTPNSLSLYLGQAQAEESKYVVQVIGGLSYGRVTETHLRRVAWLGLDAHARESWNSVLTSAYQGRLSLRLPHARLSTWAWGIRVAGGVLACELLTPHLDFWLPDKEVQIQMRRKLHPFPKAPPLRLRTNILARGEDLDE